MTESVLQYLFEKLGYLGENLGQWLSSHGFKIILIIFVAWLAKHFGAKLLSRILRTTIREDLYPTQSDRERRLRTIDNITNAVLKVAVFIVALTMIISELGVNTAPLVASAGVIGIALGLGAQSLIQDFTNGIFIIIDNQYRVGDYVELNSSSSSSVSGTVEAISIRTTALRSLNGTLYHVPNGSITTTANMTMGVGGMYEEILVGHDSDIAKVATLIDTVGENMKADPEFTQKITKAPRFVRVDGFDLNGLKIKVLCATIPNESWNVRGEFYRRLIAEFRKAKIDLPSTQLTINSGEVKHKKTSEIGKKNKS